MVFGVVLGIFVGALPGVGAALGMAIILPLTFGMEGTNAILLLIGIYSGGMYGGAISAVLLNVPGTGAAAATTMDGYPMARKGQALEALSISAFASSVSGFMTVIALFLVSPFLVTIVTAFGTPENFLLAIVGIAMITVVTRGPILKGLASGAFGLLITTVGVAPMTPETRFVFDLLQLYEGIDYISVLIGLFAIAEMLILAGEKGSIDKDSGGISLDGNVLEGVKTVVSHPITMVKSAFIGMGIGSIPGSGAVVSTFFAYSEAVRSSDDPDSFGEGKEEALVATESANNGTVGGSLIPTFAFGIPGSGSTAVLLGGLITHGLVPGEELLTTNIDFTYTIFLGLLLGNIIILAVGLGLVTRFGYITKIDIDYIIPSIIVLSLVGALTLRFNWFDVLIATSLGMVGYFMKKYNYSVISFVLGVILGPLAEDNLSRSLDLSGGSLMIFIDSPISMILVLLLFLILFGPIVQQIFKEQTII
jgi:putative tricarboxylic transport membrane protein